MEQRRPRPRMHLIASLALIIATIAPHSSHAQRASLRLGPATAIGADYEFTRVSQAKFGPGALLALSQPRDHKVLLFDLGDPTRPTASAGRRGEGPGEFTSLHQFGWLGSELWITDGSRPHAEFFDTRGRLRGSRRVEMPAAPGRYARFFGPTAILRDSAVLFVPSAMAFPQALPPGAADAVVPILLQRAGQTTYDTLARIQPVRRLLVLVGDRGASVGSQPLLGDDFVRTGQDGRRILLVLQSGPAVADGRVRIEVRNDAGAVVVQTGLDLRGSEVTPREWDDMFARYVTSNTGATWSTRALATAGLRTALHRPGHHPILTDAVLGQDGTIWLQKRAAPGAEAEWLVLTPAGQVRGSVMLPATTRVLDVTADRVVGVSIDRDDVETPFWARVVGR